MYWYDQAYLSFHMGLYDASLSLIFLILERITRDTYNKIIPMPKKESNVDWNEVLVELEKYFATKKTKLKELKAIDLVKWMKEKGLRNKHQHADVDAILSKYDFPILKYDIDTKESQIKKIKGNSNELSKEMQIEIKNKITFLTNFKFLESYLPVVIKALYKYH
jgi:hypothetical protein